MRVNRLFGWGVLVLAMLVLVAPIVSQDMDTELEEKAWSASPAWDEAFNAADVAQVMALYADDVISMPPGLVTRQGKESFRPISSGSSRTSPLSTKRPLSIFYWLKIWPSNSASTR